MMNEVVIYLSGKFQEHEARLKKLEENDAAAHEDRHELDERIHWLEQRVKELEVFADYIRKCLT